MRSSLDRDDEVEIVTVEISIGTTAKDRFVLLFAPLRVVELVRGAKPLSPLDADHAHYRLRSYGLQKAKKARCDVAIFRLMFKPQSPEIATVRPGLK